MSGHLIESIGSILWADSEIERITIDYDAVSILIRESTGIERTVVCEGYIGYRVIGFWDEMIVRSGTIERNHQFIADCLKRIRIKYGGNTPPETGNAVRNRNDWFLLKIVLIDETEIAIACGDVKVD